MRLFVVFTVLLLSVSLLPAQEDYKISDVTISSGRGALSSGIFGSVNIVSENRRLIFEVEKDFVEAMYGSQQGDFFLAGSGGFFQNTPWVGPYIIFKKGILTAVSWNGIAAGQANNPEWKLKFLFAFHSVRLDLSPFYIAWTRISFQKDAVNDLPGAGIGFKFGNQISCSVGGEYTLRDKKPLFGASLNYAL